MSGLDNFLSQFGSNNFNDKVEQARKTAINDKLENGEIDTCFAVDTGKWETGICIDGDHWYIVETYLDKKQAILGHKKWFLELKKGISEDKLDKLEDNNLSEWAGFDSEEE